MKITFLKDCDPTWDSGWSAYKKGDLADLVRGANLVKRGIAREGWGTFIPEPEPEQSNAIYANEKANATKGAIKLANAHGLLLYSIADGDERITVGDVKKHIED
jgi:hypothetical protein